jgi:hypothetical protein
VQKAGEQCFLMERLRIIGLALLSAIAYGIIHDQITARICVEYFTMGHPPIFSTTSPTLLALGWGVVATWWVGLPLGLVLSLAARGGTRPALCAADLRRPIAVLLLAMGACAALAGVVGGILAVAGKIYLVPPMSKLVPVDHHIPFLVDRWMHSASYASGILGGVSLAVWVWRRRAHIPAAAI